MSGCLPESKLLGARDKPSASGLSRLADGSSQAHPQGWCGCIPTAALDQRLSSALELAENRLVSGAELAASSGHNFTAGPLRLGRLDRLASGFRTLPAIEPTLVRTQRLPPGLLFS